MVTKASLSLYLFSNVVNWIIEVQRSLTESRLISLHEMRAWRHYPIVWVYFFKFKLRGLSFLNYFSLRFSSCT